MENVDEAIERGWPYALQRVRDEGIFIEDTVADLESWGAFCEYETDEEENAPGLETTPTRPPPLIDDYVPPPPIVPTPPLRRDSTRVGRNDPCPCGSGKKFKKCCGARA